MIMNEDLKGIWGTEMHKEQNYIKIIFRMSDEKKEKLKNFLYVGMANGKFHLTRCKLFLLFPFFIGVMFKCYRII